MKFENVKIQPSDISAKGVSSAPDRLSGTAAENKAVFDRLIKDVVAEKFNSFFTDWKNDAVGSFNCGSSQF